MSTFPSVPGDYTGPSGSFPAATSDYAAAGGANGPHAAGDYDGPGVADCACCGGNCPDTPGCDWPPPSVNFPISGLTDTSVDSCCYGLFLPDNVSGVADRVVAPVGAADCLNRTELLAHTVSDRGVSEDGTTLSCTDTWRRSCLTQTVTQPDGYVSGSGAPLGPWSVRIAWLVTVTRTKDIATGDPGPVSVSASVFITVTADLYSFILCFASAHWQRVFAPADWDCAGPWELPLDSSSGSLVAGWPTTLSLMPGSEDVGVTDNCGCDFTTVDCSGPTASYNCVDGTCIDPGDGTGAYATLDECLAACLTPEPIGEGDDDGEDGVTGLSCCTTRGVPVPQQRSRAMIPVVGCPDLMSTGGMAWSNGAKAWLGNDILGGHFFNFAAYCLDEIWGLKIWIDGALVVDLYGDEYGQAGECPDITILWTFALPPGTGGCPGGGTVSFEFAPSH